MDGVKTQSVFLLHFAACAVACLGCSHFFLLCCTTAHLVASPAAKNSSSAAKLGYIHELLSFVQHKSPEIVCSLEAAYL